MPKRSVRGEDAAIVPTGVQTLQDRFGRRNRRSDHDDLVPPVAPWRCNLTGLSQQANLYFVACMDKIYVYLPQYPTQALPQDPALVVSSEPSTYGLRGYLDRRNPHAINNLVVQSLGTEEVVAVVRDDGDVDAFLVRHIVRAIESDRAVAADDTFRVSVGADIRPFFQSNVGMSAWGLAIHSQARVIAVSANTHNITVFKFGLVQNDHGDDEEHQTANHPDRRDDVAQQVLNGTSNVPHIAFCNTGDDPHARWLLTTDITGYCRSIDLFEMRATQTFRFGRPMSYLSSSDHDPINSGWFVGFLDRRSFVQQDSVHAALGMDERDVMDGTPAIWDIGQTVSHIPDTNSKFSVARRHRRQNRHGRSSLPSVSTSGVQSPVTESDVSPSLNGTTMSEQLSQDTSALPEPEIEDPDGYDSDEPDESDSGDSSYWIDDVGMEGEGTEDDPSFTSMYGGRRTYGNAPRAYQPFDGVCDLPCPILHASVRNVYLLQPSTPASDDSPFTRPTIAFANALHQLVHSRFSYLNVFERLNMHAQIPAIGIVIFASQKGRVVVLGLTKLVNRTARYPPDWARGSNTVPTSRVTYAMRFERILPLAHQEEAGQRPFAPLAGIATGPIQGTEHLPDDRKRWRLMIYYADHTIFSYEISRKRHRDSAVDIPGLVV